MIEQEKRQWFVDRLVSNKRPLSGFWGRILIINIIGLFFILPLSIILHEFILFLRELIELIK